MWITFFGKLKILSYICYLIQFDMCTYLLVDCYRILDRLKLLEPNSPEKIFLLELMNNSNKIHLDRHNYFIDRLIETNTGDENKITMLEKCKI